MKKILSSIMVCFLLAWFSNAYAQTATTDKTKTKTDKTKTTAANPTKKDGSADMRFKANKNAAKAAPASTPAAATTTAPAPKPVASTTKPAPATTSAKPAVVNPVNKSADKVVGTDAKGRTIYEGAKGGRYTLTAAGNKEYIKH